MINGRTGKGTKLFELEDAQRLAQELNREYPNIHHEVIDASPPVEPLTPALDLEAGDHSEVDTEDPIIATFAMR